MNRSSSLRRVGGASIAVFLGLVTVAGGAGANPPRPPREAFAACSGKARGAACSMTIHDRTVDGVCDAPPNETELACRPNHPPAPPPEAFSACDGKARGDACTVQFPDATVDGVCDAPPGETKLACRPNHPPPQ